MYEKDMPLAPHPAPPQTSESQQGSMCLNNNWVGTHFNYTWNGQTHAIGQGWWTNNFADISPYMPRDGTGTPKEAQQLVRQAYRAAISFTDRNIGQVLDAAKANGLYQNTIVVLWADHGYELGDNGLWGKHTDFEHATRIPFMMRLPSFKPGRTAAFVENADLMPTLSELALGDTVPRCPRDAKASRAIELCTEGLSLFAPLPTHLPTTPWKAASFSQYQRLSL